MLLGFGVQEVGGLRFEVQALRLVFHERYSPKAMVSF